jgi:acetoin utilization deacetylase AcuC-like enzyme
LKVVYTPAHAGHDPRLETVLGVPIAAREVPERVETIRRALAADDGFEFVAPTDHGLEPVVAVHDPHLVQFLETAWADAQTEGHANDFLVADTYPSVAMFEGMSEAVRARGEPRAAVGRAGWWGLDTANPIVEGTYAAARAAVDTALTAADLVLEGEAEAYGLCRPPGHHAGRSLAGGYCFFNNAAVAAEAVARATAEPVAILDLDFHHGNGTQQIFWRRPDVLYVSLHGDPDRQYPWFLGRAHETGEGEGSGANVNIPLPAGTDDEAYLEALDRGLEAIAATAGSVIVVSLGFDTSVDDPLGDFVLTTEGYREAGRRVARLGRRLIVLQEGGYHVPTLGGNALAWLRGCHDG